jgi:hypothetical protein
MKQIERGLFDLHEEYKKEEVKEGVISMNVDS